MLWLILIPVLFAAFMCAFIKKSQPNEYLFTDDENKPVPKETEFKIIKPAEREPRIHSVIPF